MNKTKSSSSKHSPKPNPAKKLKISISSSKVKNIKSSTTSTGKKIRQGGKAPRLQLVTDPHKHLKPGSSCNVNNTVQIAKKDIFQLKFPYHSETRQKNLQIKKFLLEWNNKLTYHALQTRPHFRK